MSLDLQPDLDLDGSVGSADAAALAADWDRKWLIPAGTNAFPLKVFNDVALPGVYTLALDGPSNVVARYGNVTVRGGESNAVAFPPGPTAETVLVQAEGPGEAVLTLSFQGTGAAAVFECETQVEIKAVIVMFKAMPGSEHISTRFAESWNTKNVFVCSGFNQVFLMLLIVVVSLFTQPKPEAEVRPLMWGIDKFFLPAGEPKRPLLQSVGFWFVLLSLIYLAVYVIWH